MRLLLILFLLFCSIVSHAQHIEATNEDSTRHQQFRLKQGIECAVSVNDRSTVVRGQLAFIDSTSFQLKLGPGYYTRILLHDLIRIRHRRYTGQRLAGAGLGSSLLGGSTISSHSLGSAPLIALSALTGLGIALASESGSFRHRDPSIYQGWSFRTSP